MHWHMAYPTRTSERLQLLSSIGPLWWFRCIRTVLVSDTKWASMHLKAFERRERCGSISLLAVVGKREAVELAQLVEIVLQQDGGRDRLGSLKGTSVIPGKLQV